MPFSSDVKNGIAYYSDHIEHPRPSDIVERNHVKAKALWTLAFAGELVYRKHAVPYRVFFMSRNLEHALFGVGADVDEDMKERLSRAFAEVCRRNPQMLGERLRDPEICVSGTYEETWGYIQEGVHSLERGTNLGLLLDAEVA